ncbi:hypothetical protein CYY_002803 [Polysphondylium violaceum]|uniref:EGF-like domain-containing protein n=1 Tax=Polysphondylium violaceum TaxID=133409 RepID=A0A8J4Q0M7_9MYCE|nr:hypothetical protein CYY_002803 [Polysphondylium violaceum]
MTFMKSFSLLIICCLIISTCSSIELINLTPKGQNDRYALGSTNTCTLKYTLLVSDPSGLVQFDQVYTGGTRNANINSTTTVYTVTTEGIPLGTTEIQYSVTAGDSTQQTFSIENYNCLASPVVKFSFLLDLSPLSKQFYFKVPTLTLKNTPDITVSCTNGIICTVKQKLYNIYGLGIEYPITSFSRNFEIQVSFDATSQSGGLTQAAPFSSITPTFDSIQSLPPTGANLGFFSSYLQFSSENQNETPFFLTSQGKYPIPISGSPLGQTTYLREFISYSNPTNTIYLAKEDNPASTVAQSSPILTIVQNFPTQPVGDIAARETDPNCFVIDYSAAILTAPRTSYSITFTNRTRPLVWPFGYVSGTNHTTLMMSFSFPIANTSYNTLYSVTLLYTDSYNIFLHNVDNQAPFIESMEMIQVPNKFAVLLRMHITDSTGFLYLAQSTSKLLLLTKSDLVYGDFFDGWYERYIDLKRYGYTSSYNLCDVSNNCETYEQVPVANRVYLYPPIIQPPVFPTDFYKNTITNISFEKNNIDLTNQSVQNTMYITMSNSIPSIPPAIALPFSAGDSENDIMYDLDWFTDGQWNSSSNRFEVPFTLPMNMYTSSVRYRVSYLDNVYDADYIETFVNQVTARLSVASNNADVLGPVITSMTAFPSTTVSIETSETIQAGFDITISDDLNGFRNGNITLVNSYGVEYFYEFLLKNATNTLSAKEHVFRFAFFVDANCLATTYSIKKLYLFDNAGLMSTYGVDDSRKALYTFDFNQIPTVSVSCNYVHPPDDSPPLLKSLSAPATLDVSDSSRLVNIQLVVQDVGSGINLNINPTVYLQGLGFDMVECKTSLINSNKTTSTYRCSTSVPFLFGYPEGIFLSVYGIVDNHSNYRGYSTSLLKDSSLQSRIPTYKIAGIIPPIIASTSSIGKDGGVLSIYGNGFSLTDQSFVQIDLLDGQGYKPVLQTFNGSSLLVVNIFDKLFSPFKIKVLANSLKSNEYIVKPIGYVDSSSSSDSSDSSDSNVDSSVDSSDENESCINNCGGPERGICTTKGCKCNTGWIGVDCMSKVAPIDLPKTNTTNPSVDIILNNSNIKFKGSVSIISLVERSNTDQIVNEYPIDTWAHSNEIIDGIENNHYAKILVNKNDQSYVNLNVTTQFFGQDRNITFAGMAYLMNQNTMKFSINITKYTFTSQTNYLQVVMAASMSADTGDSICSEQFYGSLSNSEYFKLQVDDTSLYGKFIKRAIIDKRIETITNTFLNDTMITKPKESSTLIGINVRYYQQSVQLDPDFSMLVEISKASKTCSAKDKAGLTTAQLAGIIVAASVVFIGLAIVGGFFLFKRFKYSAPILKMRNLGKKNNSA